MAAMPAQARPAYTFQVYPDALPVTPPYNKDAKA
jgi:hypothetical protein